MITLRSSIKPNLKRHVLLRGTLFAALGALILLSAGIFIPVSSLTYWGFPLFIIGLGLITLGLLPYRKLTNLETTPNEIIIPDDFHFIYQTNRKARFSVSFNSIEKMEYQNGENEYGIKIWLRQNSKPVVLLDNQFCMKSFQKKSKHTHCNMYFPFFKEVAYNELCDFLKS